MGVGSRLAQTRPILRGFRTLKSTLVALGIKRGRSGMGRVIKVHVPWFFGPTQLGSDLKLGVWIGLVPVE